MKRSLISSAVVFVITALVGTALNAHANAAAKQPANVTTVYWAQ